MTRVSLSLADGVARLTFTRPEASNSLDLPTARELKAAVGGVAAAVTSSRARVLVVRAEGEVFCAGGDLASMADADDPQAYLEELASTVDAALRDLARLELPVVAVVQGSVAGAGLAVVLSADVVLSAASARYLMAYAQVGLTPDCGVSWLLPRTVGLHRALELAVTGRVLAGEEAREWGLVTELVPDEGLAARADEMVAALVASPTHALAGAKRLLRSAWDVSRAESGAEEARTIAAALTHPDAQARVAAFLKR